MSIVRGENPSAVYILEIIIEFYHRTAVRSLSRRNYSPRHNYCLNLDYYDYYCSHLLHFPIHLDSPTTGPSQVPFLCSYPMMNSPYSTNFFSRLHSHKYLIFFFLLFSFFFLFLFSLFRRTFCFFCNRLLTFFLLKTLKCYTRQNLMNFSFLYSCKAHI